jgi:hypothetical protein
MLADLKRGVKWNERVDINEHEVASQAIASISVPQQRVESYMVKQTIVTTHTKRLFRMKVKRWVYILSPLNDYDTDKY